MGCVVVCLLGDVNGLDGKDSDSRTCRCYVQFRISICEHTTTPPHPARAPAVAGQRVEL
jgi:hypothetical protein